MDFSKILTKHYKENAWGCGETYESMMWQDLTTPKPSKEHLESLWNDLLIDEMREERNQLLKDSDYTALPDYPNREAWLDYRQQLRDFPSVWSVGVSFPTKPI
jgi:hypothetical protein